MGSNVLQRWKGVVEERQGEHLWVRWTDLTDPERDETFSELHVSSIDEPEQAGVAIGTLLEWQIHGEEGTTKTVSRIRVVASERWTEQDVQGIDTRAKQLLERLQRNG